MGCYRGGCRIKILKYVWKFPTLRHFNAMIFSFGVCVLNLSNFCEKRIFTLNWKQKICRYKKASFKTRARLWHCSYELFYMVFVWSLIEKFSKNFNKYYCKSLNTKILIFSKGNQRGVRKKKLWHRFAEYVARWVWTSDEDKRERLCVWTQFFARRHISLKILESVLRQKSFKISNAKPLYPVFTWQPISQFFQTGDYTHCCVCCWLFYGMTRHNWFTHTLSKLWNDRRGMRLLGIWVVTRRLTRPALTAGFLGRNVLLFGVSCDAKNHHLGEISLRPPFELIIQSMFSLPLFFARWNFGKTYLHNFSSTTKVGDSFSA